MIENLNVFFSVWFSLWIKKIIWIIYFRFVCISGKLIVIDFFKRKVNIVLYFIIFV